MDDQDQYYENYATKWYGGGNNFYDASQLTSGIPDSGQSSQYNRVFTEYEYPTVDASFIDSSGIPNIVLYGTGANTTKAVAPVTNTPTRGAITQSSFFGAGQIAKPAGSASTQEDPFPRYHSPSSTTYDPNYASTRATTPSQMGVLYKQLLSAMPTAAQQAIPTYVAPKWDKKEIKKYSAQFSSPYITEIRRAIRDALLRSGSYSSPVLRRYAAGGAIEKASEGLGKVMSQATQYGTQAYGNEYGRLVDESKTNYMANINNIYQQNALASQQNMMLFNAALRDFLSA